MLLSSWSITGAAPVNTRLICVSAAVLVATCGSHLAGAVPLRCDSKLVDNIHGPSCWTVGRGDIKREHYLDDFLKRNGGQLGHAFVLDHKFSHTRPHRPPTSVPEPGTLALLGVGILGAVFAGRRKAR